MEEEAEQLEMVLAEIAELELAAEQPQLVEIPARRYPTRRYPTRKSPT